MYQKLILDKISSVLDVTTPGNDDKLMQLLDQAGRVFVTGAGRSGLVSRFFAMRLTHCGYKVSMVGEIVTPSIQAGDLFIVISGSGGTETLLPLVKKAKSMNAKVVVISMKDKSPMAEMADLVVQVGKDESYGKLYEMPMGSVFELTSLIYLEAIIAKIMHAKGLTEESMRAIHANLE